MRLVVTCSFVSLLIVVIQEQGLVSCLENLHSSSKPVRKGVQVVASVFFGCVGLKPETAEVVCDNKIQKVTKGVDCSIRVPLGTKATFTCLGNLVFNETYNSTQCRFPGRWTPAPPKCIELPQDEKLSAAATTAVTSSNAAVAQTTTATPVAKTTTATPVAPKTTATHMAPTTTATPVAPKTTATHMAPTTTATPVAPTTKAAPVASTTTATPVAPKTTATPVAPTTTATPVASTTTATPVASTTTATPVAPKTTAAVVTTSEPLLIPIATKTYDYMGLVSLYNVSRTKKEGQEICMKSNAKLLYLDSPHAQASALDLIRNSPLSGTGMDILLDPELDPITLAFKTSWGVAVTTPKWCTYHPSAGKSCLMFGYSSTDISNTCTYSTPCPAYPATLMCREL